MNNSFLIIALAITTLLIVVIVASVLRARVAKAKGDSERFSFTRVHGEAPRRNRPGTDN